MNCNVNESLTSEPFFVFVFVFAHQDRLKPRLQCLQVIASMDVVLDFTISQLILNREPFEL